VLFRSPEAGTWIDAHEAWFVIGSSRVGGMGAPEAVPFSERDAAQRFADNYGGVLGKLDDIPHDYILGSGHPEEGEHEMTEHTEMGGHMEMTGHDETAEDDGHDH